MILLGVLGGVIAWGNVWGFRMLICLFCALAALEWGKMIRISGKPGQHGLAAAFGIAYPLVLSFVVGSNQGNGVFAGAAFAPLALVLLVILSFTWEMRRPIVGSRSLRSVGNTLVAFIFPVWMFAFSIVLMEIWSFGWKGAGLPQGVKILLWLVLFTKLTDIFAYVSGLAMGGRIFKDKRMIPHISPKKTWEGLIGSFILSVAAGFWIGRAMGVLPSSALVCILLMAIVFILAVIGDLAASLVKRSLSIKDSGSLLPGIGGVVDLIDSPAFTVPAVFYIEYCLFLAGGTPLFLR